MSDTVSKEWYVIHTYSGYENKVKDNIEKRVESLGMEDKIFRIVVPEEKETILTPTGKKKEVNRKTFPGYVLVELVMTDDSWFVVRNTPGVTGFVGSHESAEQAVLREVKEETNITINLDQIEQLKTVSTPGRDPRTWIITIGYIVYLPYEQVLEMQAQDDALEVKLITVNVKDNAFYDGDKLLTKDDFAFDHYDLIQEAISRMQGHDSWKPNFFQMLGYEFTVTEILNLVKAILINTNRIYKIFVDKDNPLLYNIIIKKTKDFKEGHNDWKNFKWFYWRFQLQSY